MPVSFPTRDPETGALVPTDYYPLGEVAELMHVSVTTVRRRIKEGEWSYFSPVPGSYYMSAAHVAEVIERNTHPARRPDTPEPPRLGLPVAPHDLEPIR